MCSKEFHHCCKTGRVQYLMTANLPKNCWLVVTLKERMRWLTPHLTINREHPSRKGLCPRNQAFMSSSQYIRCAAAKKKPCFFVTLDQPTLS
mmetsp:Transcript_17622/g.48884  ORF Transcript_17622/g.48884 Transcript_17622/m.48884 type:complete len:92 (-) Transcript_17622:3431-3706(-)